MRIRVMLELDIEPCGNATLEELGMERVRDSVGEAIAYAIQYAEGEGHSHSLENEISIIEAAIHVLND